MKKIYLIFFCCILYSFSFSQVSYPTPFALAGGTYSFTSWDSLSAAGTYPPNMKFYFTIQPESTSGNGYDSSKEAGSNYNCKYNLTSRNRIIGLDANGIAFQATSSAQYDDCSGMVTTADSDRFVGVAELALSTIGKTNVGVKWKGTVIFLGNGNGTTDSLGDTINRRQYTLRLQYRVGATGKYTDVTTAGKPVEFNSIGKVNGSTANLAVTLPTACNNQATVYLRWVYFQEETGSGTRPELALDDIQVGANLLPISLVSFNVIDNNGNASLSWQTEDEVNFSRFNVEKSADAVNFSAISTIAGQSKPGIHTYSYSDDKIFTGNNYYRLKLIDNDGKFSYSGVLLFTAATAKGLLIYPNPVAGNLVLMHPKAGTGSALMVFGYDGKKLAVYPVQENSIQTSVNVSKFTTGNYIVIFSDNKQRLTGKFTKQ